MTDKLPDTIYLIPEGDRHTYLWCDDPDPTGYGDASEAVRYTRAPSLEQIIEAINELDTMRHKGWTNTLANTDVISKDEAIAAVEKLFNSPA
jgi:hypothetical protein